MLATKTPTRQELEQAMNVIDRASAAHAQTKKAIRRNEQISRRIAKDHQLAKEYNDLAKALFDELNKALSDERSKDLLFNLYLLKEGSMRLNLYPSGLSENHRKTYAYYSREAKKLLRGKK